MKWNRSYKTLLNASINEYIYYIQNEQKFIISKPGEESYNIYV